MFASETLVIRKAEPADLMPSLDIFKRSIWAISDQIYSEKQKQAWSSSANDEGRWEKKWEQLEVLVASIHDQVVGFIGVADDTLDLLYVDPDFSRRGIASRLVASVEDDAHVRGIPELKTFASHAARVFFLARGWEIIRENQVERNGVVLENALMVRRAIHSENQP